MMFGPLSRGSGAVDSRMQAATVYSKAHIVHVRINEY